MSKKVKVGVFLFGGIVLFTVGLFLIGGWSDLFGNHFTVYTEFRDTNTMQAGAKVRVGGMNAGQVTGIQVPDEPSGKFRLKLKVDRKFEPLVRKDSQASIQTQGMVGNQFVNIKPGTDSSPECNDGCTIPSQEAASMGELMRKGSALADTLQSTIKDVRHRADTALDNISSAAGNANGLMVAMKPKLVDMTGNADAIIAGIRAGHGTAGKLLTDKDVASNVDATISNARRTTANLDEASRRVNTIIAEIQDKDLPNLHQTLQNTQDITQQFNQAFGTFLAKGNSNESTAVALREAAHGLQQTATNLSDDTEAIKTNFFFRGFFNRRGFYNMETLTPSKYQGTEFVQNPRVRAWVPGSELFKVRADGSQELTATGKSRLNQAMSQLVPYLPRNPIVVEGYAASGAEDQQYLASEQRAAEVRRYLVTKFHLQAKRVGIMPLADRPPDGAGKQTWDGVCLVLVVSQ